MAHLIRRRRPKDTIKKFETVAERKYQAGLDLVDASDNHTGVEQFAFAAEMWLKSAYFRCMRAQIGLARTTSEVTIQHLRDAANEAIRWVSSAHSRARRASIAFFSGRRCWRQSGMTKVVHCRRAWRKTC